MFQFCGYLVFTQCVPSRVVYYSTTVLPRPMSGVHDLLKEVGHGDLPPWLSGLAISGRSAVKAWLAIRQGVGSYPTPAGMSSPVSA